MRSRDIRIRSTEGGAFECHLVLPTVDHAVPMVVLASAIHGVDDDLRAIAEQFAQAGYLAAAPDLFWRTIPGPLARGDPRSVQRSAPRLEKLKAGERDLLDVLGALRTEPSWNGRAAVVGFCYGGPYAIIGPKRLGYEVGIAYHGTQMLDFIEELDGVERPILMFWGDQDHAAPPRVLAAYRARAARTQSLAVHVLPGAQHGYMMRSNAGAFDKGAYDRSMKGSLATLEPLRHPPA